MTDAEIAEWSPFAYSIASEFFRSDGDADDVRQEALIALLIALRSYDPEIGVPLRLFISLVVRRRLVTMVKQSRALRRRALSDSLRVIYLDDSDEFVPILDVIADPHSDPADVAARREDVRRLVALDLSDFERETLRRLASGMTYRETAEALGVSEKAIDNAHSRAAGKWRRAA